MQKRLEWILLLLAIVLSSSCYIYGLWSNVPGSIYTGIRPLNASDYNENLSWIDQIRHGSALLRNPYDCAEQQGFLFRPIYWILSAPFHFTTLSNTVVAHILRILCGIFLLLLTRWLLSFFMEESSTRTIAFALLFFASGVGIIFHSSGDLSIPEAIPFLTLGETPHFIYSLALIWFSIAWFYRGRTFWPIYVSIFLLWWEHPYDVIIVGAVTMANIWHLPAKDRIRYVIGLGVASILPLAYYFHLRTFPSFRAWQAQNITSSPSPITMVAMFLPVILLALPSIPEVGANRKLFFYLLIWIGVQFVLSYLPFAFQRRLICGVMFPLVIFAASTLRKVKSSAVIASVIVLLASTNGFVMWQQIQGIASRNMPFYLPQSYVGAFNWLAQQNDQEGVLSGFVTGNFIPAYGSHMAYIGHSGLTPNIVKRKQEIAAFYRTPNPEFLKSNHIRYIFCGREEKALYRCTSEGFKKLYENQEIAILRLENSK